MLTVRFALFAILAGTISASAAELGPTQPTLCLAEGPTVLTPADPTICVGLEAAVRAPSALPLDEYEKKLDQYFSNYCHRNAAAGWRRDKRMRDTGPFLASFAEGVWAGQQRGVHAPVVIWYSPEMVEWLRTYRSKPSDSGEAPPPVPDGAIMVKEMFQGPAKTCADGDPLKFFPEHGAAIMVRNAGASYDGWFWGWYGFGAASGWRPDWPPASTNPLPNMGFAQYCLNCHASAEDNATFATPQNIDGEPGEPLVFLSQSAFDVDEAPTHHEAVADPDDSFDPRRPLIAPDDAVIAALRAYVRRMPEADEVSAMPSETYDNKWASAGRPWARDEFLTSSQCLGCHDAGSTGLHFDMTRPHHAGEKLLNLSPYATWRSSPMGLAGRDPIFYAQLASETETLHPESAEFVQATCFGCHGILGARQSQIDAHAETGTCPPFLRTSVDILPGGADAKRAEHAMLARDGVSCTACHRMVLGAEDTAAQADKPENACIAERQALINPDNRGFAKTFSGSFLVGPPEQMFGPFDKPKTMPMKQAMGVEPTFHKTISAPEVCGTCHTVHLPVLHKGKTLGHVYEQATYPEWAFSAYRTGWTVDGALLPSGEGAKAASCQDCHMPSKDAAGRPFASKVASIQEYSNMPMTEHNLGAADVDLPLRENYSLHTLVGLNVFLIRMAQQFPEILGIRIEDPMLTKKGIDPLVRTEEAMLDQAATRTATIRIAGASLDKNSLMATIEIANLTGHKFPSGVGFRRAFVEFEVLDAAGNPLWVSGRTDAAGAILDAAGTPVDGEFWWKDDCSARLNPGERPHQPHYQTISRQDQVQIYQELVVAPPDGSTAPVCGHDAPPSGDFTTSFLSICAEAKDNRILPDGFLPLAERKAIAAALGAGEDLAEDAGTTAVGDDPDYVSGGGDSFAYTIPLADLPAGSRPARVTAALYYQATPPFYLQDRFCTSTSRDTDRLYFLTARLNLDGAAPQWKLQVGATASADLR